MSGPIAPGLWTQGPAPVLLGGHHPATGALTFPCPAGVDPVPLPSQGTIWSWTVQRFPPKSPPYAGPEPFRPFALAYVELPGALIVETPLDCPIETPLHVGMAVELVIRGFGAHQAFAFRPVEAA